MRLFIFGFIVVTCGAVILLISVLRTAAVTYESPQSAATQVTQSTLVDYTLANPGQVLPDSPLWFLKATRDKVWVFVTTNELRKAELLLLFSDKRIGAATKLFEKGDSEQGMAALTKAEKYLEEALVLGQENRENGVSTDEFFVHLARASLKHYEIVMQLYSIAPEALKPTIVETGHYSKRVYEQSRNHLLEDGVTPPVSPFDWE
jgi:Domain of unknown function (DUF5667)